MINKIQKNIIKLIKGKKIDELVKLLENEEIREVNFRQMLDDNIVLKEYKINPRFNIKTFEFERYKSEVNR